jgi:hypothetical protein
VLLMLSSKPGTRLPVTAAFSVGSVSARRIWYWALACSMFRIATRRSRLLASDSSISCLRRASAKKRRHSMPAAAAVLAGLKAASGKAAATGAAGRS